MSTHFSSCSKGKTTSRDGYCEICKIDIVLSNKSLQQHLNEEHFLPKWGEFSLETYNTLNNLPILTFKDPLQSEITQLVLEKEFSMRSYKNCSHKKSKKDQKSIASSPNQNKDITIAQNEQPSINSASSEESDSSIPRELHSHVLQHVEDETEISNRTINGVDTPNNSNRSMHKTAISNTEFVNSTPRQSPTPSTLEEPLSEDATRFDRFIVLHVYTIFYWQYLIF